MRAFLELPNLLCLPNFGLAKTLDCMKGLTATGSEVSAVAIQSYWLPCGLFYLKDCARTLKGHKLISGFHPLCDVNFCKRVSL